VSNPTSATPEVPRPPDVAPLDVARLAVIIVTWRRPAYVERCLRSLLEQDRRPDELVVVDASEDERTREVVEALPGVRYVGFPGGAGNTPAARNEGLLHVSCDVVAYLDDDTVARQSWARLLLQQFLQAGVAAVAGRTLNGVIGEDSAGADQIGRLLDNGTLTGHFAADPGQVVDVDHGIGANMAFRREWLAALGGLRDVFPGTQMREETDLFLRLKALGGRAVFAPDVVVDHLPAPHVRGRRFDLRYAWFAERNHIQMLALNFGLLSPIVRRYVSFVLTGLPAADRQRRRASRVVRSFARVAAMVVGEFSALRLRAGTARSPVRTDALGQQIRQHLGSGV